MTNENLQAGIYAKIITNPQNGSKECYCKKDDADSIYNTLMSLTGNDHEIAIYATAWCESVSVGETYEFREGVIEICEVKENRMKEIIDKPNAYFVHVKTDTGVVCKRIMSAAEIIRAIDMSDCSGEELTVFATESYGKLIPLETLGTWHDVNEPLLIECVDPDGNVVISGYGTDH